ncbi:hypothetical protein AVL50_26540 [Flammeovirga sp. SJP92]|nr:hypothetical protein AVL50_26540 [Flammeovirga sp. SJP92]
MIPPSKKDICISLIINQITKKMKSLNQQSQENNIIEANAENLKSNIPLNKTQEVSQFFNQPENKVKMQFPNEMSSYAWIEQSKYYPTAQVPRSGQVSELPYNVNANIGEIQYKNKDDNMVSVNQHFDTKPIDAMVVVKNGEIVYERYKTMKPDEKHLWYSVSKVTGALMLAFLEYEQKVDVNNYVSFYLPELKDSVWDTVKVEEALDMATGLNGTEHDEEIQNSRTDPDQIWYRWAATSAVGILPDVKGRNETWVDVLRSMERKTPGHQKFEYNSINTFVINRIAERVADKPLNEMFADRIWSKAGMEHDAFYMMSPSGNTLGFLGVNSSLRDLARWGMVFTPSCEKIAGEALVPQEIMDKFYDNRFVEMYDKGWIGKQNTVSFYDEAGKIYNRYQWDAIMSDGDLYKKGVGGQGVYISPENDTVVAWFCTSDGENQEEAMARAIVKAINA